MKVTVEPPARRYPLNRMAMDKNSSLLNKILFSIVAIVLQKLQFGYFRVFFRHESLQPRNFKNRMIRRSWYVLFRRLGLLKQIGLLILAVLLTTGISWLTAWFSSSSVYPAVFDERSVTSDDSSPILESGKVIESSSKVAPASLSLADIWQEWKDGLATETGYLERDEALVLFLKRHGFSQEQGSDLVLSIEDDVDLTKLRPEDPIHLFVDNHENRPLVGFQLGNQEKTVNAYLYKGNPRKEILYHELETRIFQAAVLVERSLYQDGTAQGIPEGILLDMFNRYSFDINFQSEIQPGTRYEIVYTMVYNEKNELVRSGEILYANIVLTDGRSYPIFEYTDLSGKSAFFDPNGRSVNKALLLMPVNGAYVSSNFGYRRDPILGSWRLHRGTDYAAPRGTPIRAGGTGKIITRGWSRIGYGYHIIIRHTKGYDTLYGHMSRFQPGYRVGSRVRQGDIIGYVGSTGKSTGPHVHYEVRRYGKPISLRSLRLQPSRNLTGLEKYLFNNSLRAFQARFKGLLPDLHTVSVSTNLVQNRALHQVSNGLGGRIVE